MFTYASKRFCFSTPFVNQRVNGFERLLKSARQHYFPIFPRIRDKLSCKKFALVTSEIFRLFVNTLPPVVKYSRRNILISWQQLQTPLPQEENTFCQFLIAFPKCEWNLEHSEQKEEYPRLITNEIIGSERDVYLNVYKVLLQHTIR